MLTLRDVLTGLGSQIAESARIDAVPITDVVIDSRRATAGCLFVALRGEHVDGHDYVGHAFENGARLALIDHDIETDHPVLDLTLSQAVDVCATPASLKVSDSLRGLQQLAGYWRRRHDVRVIGVTGSVGKTTTKEQVWSVLRQRYRTLRSQGNYNNEIGLPLTLLKLDATHERVVLEMGMYALGEITLLAEIAQPQVGVVTNVGPTHLERLGTIERIAQAKSELVAALPADGVAILNIDDPYVCDMANRTHARVFSYGLDPAADLWADEIESRGLEGVRLQLHYGDESIHLRAPLLGRHSVHTVLRAAAVGLVEGESWDEIVAGLQDSSAHIRLMATPGVNGCTILDDTYNASPASSIAALNLLEELEGRSIAVLGDMLELGDYTDLGHRKVGLRAKDVVARLITVGSLARIIAEEALSAGMPAADVVAVDSNAEAIAALESIIESGDIVLVKGSRGQSMEEIVAALGRPAWPTR
jgi:UDP-N-acetylmuramoyl-tripeptide--D-alanyl-D-alanine ligase